MSSHPIPIHPDLPGHQAADTQFYRQTLHDLITMGTDLARLAHAQALAAAQPSTPAPTPPPDPTAAFDRLARAIRRTITLARSLAHTPTPAPNPAHHRATTRKRILRAVEDANHRTTNPDSDAAEDLTAELHDRLDAPDLDWDLATRPIPEIITEICRDLGLASVPGDTPWKRRTPADLRQLQARAAAPPRTPQPGPAPEGQGPDPSRYGPNVQPPPAVPRSGPTPTWDSSPLDGPAEVIALTPRPPTQPNGRWHPPLSG